MQRTFKDIEVNETWLTYLGNYGDYKIYSWEGRCAPGFKLVNERLGDNADFPAYAAEEIIALIHAYIEHRDFKNDSK